MQIARKKFNAEIIALADPAVLEERAADLGIDIRLKTYQASAVPVQHIPGTLTIQPLLVSSPVITGEPVVANAGYVLETIKTATLGCLSGEFNAMVTGPVNKAIINQAGYKFSGHTEFIAELCNNAFPVMLLANEKMRLALVTTHVPLAKVSEQITAHRLEQVIVTASTDLRRYFGISRPRLLVCGLNPHAGEHGHLGDEEINIIIPTLNRLRETGLQIIGPVPADTAFTPSSLRDIDLVVAMYHDQGLPVLKSHGFGDTVNITLGLPIIRTSVDHGTAQGLAGSGKANPDSLVCAIRQAIILAGNAMLAQEIPVPEPVLN